MTQCNKYRLEHPQKRNEWRKRNYHKTTNAKNTLKRWSQSDEELVLNSDLTDFELSQKIGRSVQAIQLKRYKLLKVSE